MGISDYLRQSTTFTAHSNEPSQFYAGSVLLQPLADSSGMPIDQVNFLVCIMASLFLALFFNMFMSKSGALIRHLTEIFIGIGLLYFCFGNQISYVFLQAFFSYLIMRFTPPKYDHIANFIFCYIFLSASHIFRQIYDYGGYTLDITLPLMMLTQRLTSLAFSVHDGRTADIDTLPHDQKFFAVQTFPSILEFFSFTFYFHGSLCGPFVHYADYISFIEGINWTRFQMPTAIVDEEQTGIIGNQARPKNEIATVRIQVLHPPANVKIAEPPLTRKQIFNSCLVNGLKTFGVAIICGLLQFTLAPMFPISVLSDPEFHAKNSFWTIQFYIMCFIFATKQRYYFAWKFSDAVNIFSGLSYSGISQQGKVLWKLTDNIDIREFELGTRFAVHINAWNKTTSNWLRFMVYDRASWHPTLLTFLASALWHGFYPGYYISFMTAALFLNAVRVVRSTLRPLAELRKTYRFMYDLTAFILVRFASAYMALSFALMMMYSAYLNYRSLYFWPHVLALLALIVLPRIRPFLPESMRQKKVYGRARSNKQQIKKAADTDDSAKGHTTMSSDDFDSGTNDTDMDHVKAKSE